jgi:hypothetical protein
MSLFRKNRDLGVQSFILKLVNNNCGDLKAMAEGPRTNSRVDLMLVVMIVPVEDGQPQVGRAFAAVTKEFSNTGVAVVFKEPHALDKAILGFRFQEEMTFLRAEAKHLNPMGGGFYQLGFRLIDVVQADECPELKAVKL